MFAAGEHLHLATLAADGQQRRQAVLGGGDAVAVPGVGGQGAEAREGRGQAPFAAIGGAQDEQAATFLEAAQQHFPAG